MVEIALTGRLFKMFPTTTAFFQYNLPVGSTAIAMLCSL